MSGKLYGIGVGAGDPELLTLKAKRLLFEADRIFIPVKKLGEESRAFEIIKQAMDLSKKEIVEVVFAMKKNRQEQEEGWQMAADQIAFYLDQGEQAALITLGDVSIYSTAYYVCDRLAKSGYEVETVAGIPSFCVGASQVGVSLGEGKESFVVVPSMQGEEQIRKFLTLFDSLVIMKAAKFIPTLKKLIAEREEYTDISAYVISNSGMEDEYIGALDDTREYGYLTTVIIKQKQKV